MKLKDKVTILMIAILITIVEFNIIASLYY